MTIQSWKQILWNFLKNLNLFPSAPPSEDQYVLRTQRISTRLFLLLLVQSLIVLLIYTATVTVLKTFIVSNPSLDQYKQLYAQYPSTLACPCRQASIQYKSFVSMNYTLHDVCTSVYVTKEWITFIALSVDELDTSINPLLIALNTFRMLRSVCASIESLVSVNVLQFDSNTYFSDLVTPANSFTSQSEDLIKQFHSSTLKMSVMSLKLTNDATKGDGLLFDIRNQALIRIPFSSDTTGLDVRLSRRSCDCDTVTVCTEPLLGIENVSQSKDWFIPGFFFGCFAFDAFRKSSLKCLYSSTCVMGILNLIKFSTSLPVNALNVSATSRFQPDFTIGSILDQLMVERWNWSVSYDDYYTACHPLECRYTLATRNDAIYIVTTVIGLIGGLVTVLRMVVHGLVSRIREWLRRTRVSSGNGSQIEAGWFFIRSICYFFTGIPPLVAKVDLANTSENRVS